MQPPSVGRSFPPKTVGGGAAVGPGRSRRRADIGNVSFAAAGTKIGATAHPQSSNGCLLLISCGVMGLDVRQRRGGAAESTMVGRGGEVFLCRAC